jgi:hypothetical protein
MPCQPTIWPWLTKLWNDALVDVLEESCKQSVVGGNLPKSTTKPSENRLTLVKSTG